MRLISKTELLCRFYFFRVWMLGESEYLSRDIEWNIAQGQLLRTGLWFETCEHWMFNQTGFEEVVKLYSKETHSACIYGVCTKLSPPNTPMDGGSAEVI